ncbi:MAG: hypothetical protein KIS81_08675 [Maricaulaceae bacterium]|nr:hypothetical protein [Maricaulaceae bacterium]
MLRVLLLEVSLFALPFIAFFLWRLTRQIAVSNGGEPPPTPWAALVIAGGLAAIAGLLAMALFTVNRPAAQDQIYVPPRVEDGRVIPGHFVPRPQPEAEQPEPEDPEPGPEGSPG